MTAAESNFFDLNRPDSVSDAVHGAALDALRHGEVTTPIDRYLQASEDYLENPNTAQAAVEQVKGAMRKYFTEQGTSSLASTAPSQTRPEIQPRLRSVDKEPLPDNLYLFSDLQNRRDNPPTPAA